MVKSASLSRPNLVADFAAGDGALLQAARSRWPKVPLFASDIDSAAISGVERSLPRCRVAVRDFLTDVPGQRSDDLVGACDLILLNPPFSYRGGSKYDVTLSDTRYFGSKALAFTARALRYLKSGGELISILPASVLIS